MSKNNNNIYHNDIHKSDIQFTFNPNQTDSIHKDLNMGKIYNIKSNNNILNSDYNFIYSTANKTGYLDYTFLSHRSTLSLTNSEKMDSKKAKQYIYDLNLTLDINLNLLEKTIKLNYDNYEPILNIYKSLKKNKNLKENIRKKINDLNSKILIQKQIYEELTRKIEESNEIYQDKINEHLEATKTKNDYIKLFQKKLMEVEIYIEKITRHLKNSPYEKYKGWKLIFFLETNRNLIKKKELLKKECENIKNQINNIKKENEDIKKEEIKEKDILNIEKEEKTKKISEYIKKYKKEIFFMGNRIKLLKNYFNNLITQIKLLTFEKKDSIENKEENLISNNNNINNNNINNINNIDEIKPIYRQNTTEVFITNVDIIPSDKNDNKVNNISFLETENNENLNKDKSNLPNDITQRINTFMDFSIVLNKKEQNNIENLGKSNNLGGNPFANLSKSNIWDISAINKN
jgi:hypothetical protein